MKLSLTELGILVKLIFVPSKNGWYDIRNCKEKEGRNRISVNSSRLKSKQLLEKNGNSFYRPTELCWQLLKEFHDQIALPLVTVLSNDEKSWPCHKENL